MGTSRHSQQNATVDERFLSVQLGVQEVAAKQYISELISVGILNEDNKATPLANKWRLEDTYQAAVDELIESVYPEGLRHVAPYGEGDRRKAMSWFQQEGLGEGSAKNRAATYFLLGTKDPSEAPARGPSTRITSEETAGNGTRKRVAKFTPKPNAPKTRDMGKVNPNENAGGTGTDVIPLNVNVQIHISADAGTEQIESIFSAMRRYLYDKPTS